MKSMFFRLFISFMAIMVLTGVVGFFLMRTFHNVAFSSIRDGAPFYFEKRFAKIVVLSGEAAYKIYLHEGVTEYRRYVDELEEVTGTTMFIVGPDNRTLAGATVDGMLLPLVRQAREENRNSVILHDGNVLRVAKQIAESYILVGAQSMGPPMGSPPGPPPEFGNDSVMPFIARLLMFIKPRGDILKTLVTFVVASAVCYLLARSLTAPVRQLRAITQRVADGEFSARLEKKLRGGGSELEDLGNDFNIMAERIEKLIRSQKRLLRDISHELRSPLARLNVALELARSCSDTEKLDKLDIIEKESGRLNELIGQLLTLTELESAGKHRFDESVNLSQLVTDIVDDAAFEASYYKRGVKIISIENTTISGCSELLGRAIENVVRNAVRYTEPDTDAEVSLNRRGDRVVISVRDYGAGVPKSELQNVFEPFYRIENARERGKGGSGLGLAIARQAVQLHNGQINGHNCEPGFIVVISLPV